MMAGQVIEGTRDKYTMKQATGERERYRYRYICMDLNIVFDCVEMTLNQGIEIRNTARRCQGFRRYEARPHLRLARQRGQPDMVWLVI